MSPCVTYARRVGQSDFVFGRSLVAQWRAPARRRGEKRPAAFFLCVSTCERWCPRALLFSGVPFSILVLRVRLRDLSRIEHTLEFPLSGISVGLLPYSIQTCGIIILYGGGGASLPSCPFRLILLSQVGPVTLGLLNEFLTTPTQRREICLTSW